MSSLFLFVVGVCVCECAFFFLSLFLALDGLGVKCVHKRKTKMCIAFSWSLLWVECVCDACCV